MLRPIAIATAVGLPLAAAIAALLNWTDAGSLIVVLAVAGLGIVVGSVTALVATEPRTDHDRPPGPGSGRHA